MWNNTDIIEDLCCGSMTIFHTGIAFGKVLIHFLLGATVIKLASQVGKSHEKLIWLKNLIFYKDQQLH